MRDRQPDQHAVGPGIDDDPARVDREVVRAFRSTQACRAGWRTRADVEAQLGSARGGGLGTALATAMLDDERRPRVRWTLLTRAAHGLHQQCGFTAPQAAAMVRDPR